MAPKFGSPREMRETWSACVGLLVGWLFSLFVRSFITLVMISRKGKVRFRFSWNLFIFWHQGRSQKFVLGRYKTSILMFNCRSDVIFTSQKLYLDCFWAGVYIPHMPPVATPLVMVTTIAYSGMTWCRWELIKPRDLSDEKFSAFNLAYIII